MNVLILGGTGMLGHKLAQVLGADPYFRVACTVRREPLPEYVFPGVRYVPGVDVAGGAAPLRALLEAERPDVVINAVGAIKQKDLYAHTDETYYVNGTLPHLLALLNPNPQGRVVHYSTDCVFRGDRGAYGQDEAPDAEDLYGRSKACGELAYGRHLTLRTSIVGFELQGQLGLLSWLFRQPRGSRLRGFRKAIYSGLPTVTVARLTASLLRGGSVAPGLWHVASEPIDKLDLLERMNRRFDLGHTFQPDDSVQIDRSLDDAPFRRATGTVRPGWDALVEELADDYLTLPYARAYGATHA